MKTYADLLSYLSQFFLEWDMFFTKVQRISKHTFCVQQLVCRESCRSWDNVEKYGRARQATNDNIIRLMRLACWINDCRHTYTHTLIVFSNYCLSVATMVRRKRVSVTLYAHCQSCSGVSKPELYLDLLTNRVYLAMCLEFLWLHGLWGSYKHVVEDSCLLNRYTCRPITVYCSTRGATSQKIKPARSATWSNTLPDGNVHFVVGDEIDRSTFKSSVCTSKGHNISVTNIRQLSSFNRSVSVTFQALTYRSDTKLVLRGRWTDKTATKTI